MMLPTRFPYRALAGLPQPEGVKGRYGGWDSGLIRGHMAGHCPSAASRMAAATGDARCIPATASPDLIVGTRAERRSR